MRTRRMGMGAGVSFMACVLTFGVPAKSDASLVGDAIDGNVDINSASASPIPGFIPVVIDPGIDGTIVVPYGGGQTLTTTVDFGPDTLTIRLVNSNAFGGTSTGNGMSFAFSSLDFGGGQTISNVVTLQNDFGFGAPSFSANSVSASRPGLFIFTPSLDITSSYRFETVPEPASLTLLGLGGLALLRRRRRHLA